MARKNPHHETKQLNRLYDAASQWCEKCLKGNGSIFSNKKLWTANNLSVLDEFFVKNLDEGEGKFWRKLERQLKKASSEGKQLMAEILWVVFLFSSNLSISTKREKIKMVWDWSVKPEKSLPENHPMFESNILGGIGSTGVGLNTHRWRELIFFIKTLIKFKTKNGRKFLNKGPWEFAKWMDDAPKEGTRQLACILPHLIFPNEFERISKRDYKYEILLEYKKYLPDEYAGKYKIGIKKLPLSEIDGMLLDLRRVLERQYGKKIDFYDNFEAVDETESDDKYIDQIISAGEKLQKVEPFDNSDSKLKTSNKKGGESIDRNHKVGWHAVVASGFKCEYDPSHITFKSNRTNKNYVEAHHLIPASQSKNYMEEQGKNIDCIENVVALCPNCHRAVHHGKPSVQEKILKKLYNDRQKQYKKINLNVKWKTLLRHYMK